MKTYNTIYSFEVLDKIKEGAKVYVLDREEKAVYCVNDISVADLAQLEIFGKTNKKRFEYWIEEITEEIEE